MTGVGTVSAVPDQVGFDVSVGLTRPDLSTALDDASTTMTKVLARLADFGVVKDRRADDRAGDGAGVRLPRATGRRCCAATG